MKLPRHYRRSLAATAAVLTAAVLAPAQPAFAAPVIDSSVAPQSGPTAGGTPIRIYGTGFTGVNDVEIENRNATDYKFVDDTLITAVVPSALNGTSDNNTFVDVEVTTTGGTTTAVDAFYYTNATFTVTGANPPFSAGDPITTTLDNYKPSTNVVLPQFNPLLVYIEKFPAFSPPVPPPYADILVLSTTTDVNGDATVNTNLGNPFDGGNDAYPDNYDANIACPVNQTTANYLGNSASASLDKPAYSGKCMVANGQYGTATLERAIDMTNDLTPAVPTLVPSVSSVSRGSFVTVTGINWNANPFFGSTKTVDGPGETAVKAQICNTATSICSSTVGNVAVDMSRYIYNSGTSVFDFSGAYLHGGIQAGNDLPSPCTTCVIRVTQDRPASGSSPIVKEAAININ